jgi:HD-GYP domain-containing protein (c-di-GMP phosphodiesterase class II)
VYRRFLDVCQTERRIGILTFTNGLEEREVGSVLEAFTDGVGGNLTEWTVRNRLTHVSLGPPIEADKQSGETIARRAYSGTIEAMRDVEVTIRRREPLSMEQLSTLGVLTSAMLQQIVADTGLALRLASIKSYDEYTLYHSVNVCVISIGLGVAIGLPDNILRELAIAALLHDLGKIAVPLEILRKPGLLDEPEWRIMRRHPVRGADLLSRMPGSNRLPMIVSFEHQMRYDLKGYPFVREDWAQHPFSRIVCLADIFDAMTTRRAYKPAIPTEKVLAFLRDEAGKSCDPRLVTVLEQLVRALPAEATAEASA